ncbi:hypothetical protein RVR_9732 [Actinacidiphila reveromycinica]|uniref:Uncharacterized protein n=1 Tax=Actinacidiphila reveromycinica TaxID=659352 RepID=A0A7U3VST4_9ACTN|nr:hypothetical protein [Streptomyces sp. SN-593]BBB02035.1 hypothetical protein RVR_9732 [Streptomyces sp. SN-593]
MVPPAQPPRAGDEFTVSIGGDASGPVVVGRDNHVEVHQPAPVSVPEPPPDAAASTQTNTAKDHGTVYAVTGGDMHIHQVPDGNLS